MDIISLIESLEIGSIFKDKAKEEGDGVMDALSTILRLLGGELEAAYNGLVQMLLDRSL